MSMSYPLLSVDMINNIGRGVSGVEVEDALKSMGPLKAPGPDRLNPLFFQSQWNQVSVNVVNFVQRVFQFPSLIREVKRFSAD